MKCKICGSNATVFGKSEILGKHPAAFYRCDQCGFMQTETPYWLEEAYSDTITKSDIGLVSRNLKLSDMTQRLILAYFDPTQKFIDYGGGYGLFVRLMRDQGFDFYRHDPLCKNLFAEGFEASPGVNFALLTAWEVFEHLQNPLPEIEQMISYSPNLLFSTLTLPKEPKPLDEWWYYGLEHGQHVSFYSSESLHVIARKFNLKVHYSKGSIHFIGDKSINPRLIRILFDHRLNWLKKFFIKSAPPSLLASDYHAISGNTLND